MNEYYGILKEVKLFSTIEEHELEQLLKCLNAKVISAKKDDIILSAGDPVLHIGLVLEGNLHIVKDDINGERVLVGMSPVGEIFAEAICCIGVKESPISVIATTESKIMLLEFARVLHTCPKACVFHAKLIENMLSIVANKNLMLQNRIGFISKRTLRAKVLCYLESFPEKRGSSFNIPFNREQMSEFLCVDRSALSHELSRMRKEGVLDYHKNSFKLL